MKGRKNMDEKSLSEIVEETRKEVSELTATPPVPTGRLARMPREELVERLRTAMIVCVEQDERIVATAQILSDTKRDLRAEKRRSTAMGEKISTLEAEVEQTAAARAAVEQLLEMGVLTAGQLLAAGWPYELPGQAEEDITVIRARAAADGMHLYWMALTLEDSAYEALGDGAHWEHFSTPAEAPGINAGDGDNMVVGWAMTPAPTSPYLLEELWLVPDAPLPAPNDRLPAYAQGVMTQARPETRSAHVRAEIEADLRKPGAMPR